MNKLPDNFSIYLTSENAEELIRLFKEHNFRSGDEIIKGRCVNTYYSFNNKRLQSDNKCIYPKLTLEQLKDILEPKMYTLEELKGQKISINCTQKEGDLLLK